MEDVIRKPKEHYPDDQECSYCDEKPIIILDGPQNCGTCGCQINLCKTHIKEFLNRLTNFLWDNSSKF